MPFYMLADMLHQSCLTYAAVGPVSASPSPTTQVTTRSGLSITAPKETARAYPSSPPSCIEPGVSGLIWLTTLANLIIMHTIGSSCRTLGTLQGERTL